jgi:hypothetical protein
VNSAVQNAALDNQVQADFATGPLIHKVLVGFDYQYQTATSDYKFASIAPIDVFAPVYGAFLPPPSTLPSFINTDTSLKQAGLYAQDQIKLDRWTLTLTGRQDWAQAETVSKGIFPAAGTYLQNDRASTGRVGLNYLFVALRQLLDLVRADVGHRPVRKHIQADDGRGCRDRPQVQTARIEFDADGRIFRHHPAECADRRSD